MDKTNEFSLPVPWGHIAVKAWGDPSNFPILCAHGILDNAGVFDRLIAQLPKKYYYVSIDLPGHGFSSNIPAGIPLDFFNYVLSLRYVVKGLKWKTFKYIGHSLGSQLGILYSIIYPNQIESLILIEGIVAEAFDNKLIIPRIRSVLNATFEADSEVKCKSYGHKKIMYLLRCGRQNCLNTAAAEALFKRSVTPVGELFKYNRDVRLKKYLMPIFIMFSMDQWVTILSNLKVKILLIYTTGTLDSLTRNQNSLVIQVIQNLTQNFSNIKLLNVLGNHDIHNNNPEKLSYEISKFLDKLNIVSKL